MKRIIFLFFALYAIFAYTKTLPIYYKSDYYPNRIEYIERYLCVISEDGVTYYDEWLDQIWFYDNARFHITDTITCIAADKDKFMWLGTFGDGIYQKDTQIFLTSHYNYYWKETTPLTCYSIAFDSESKPWGAGVY